MNMNLLIIGILLLVCGYFIGVKEKIELITFLRNRRVTDRKKVALLIGGSQVILGAVMIILGVLGFKNDPMVIVLVLLVILSLSLYVVKKFVQ